MFLVICYKESNLIFLFAYTIEKREYSKDENYSSLENRRLFEQASFQEDLSRNRFNKVCTFQNQMIGDEKSKINQIGSSANSDFTDEI